MAIEVNALSCAVPSYSIAGEDMALRKLFREKIIKNETGIYLDVGCSHPVTDSNTYLLYTYGWRGLCIDARDKSEAFFQHRPRDVFAHAAVGFSGNVFLHTHLQNTGMSKVSAAETLQDQDFASNSASVSGATLDSLIDEHLPGVRVDLISIDVEGSEMEVLTSCDWERHQPSIVIMECHEFTFSGPSPPTVNYLADRGYILIEKIGANVIMRRT